MKVQISELRRGQLIVIGGKARAIACPPQKFGSQWDLWLQGEGSPYRLSIASDVIEVA